MTFEEQMVHRVVSIFKIPGQNFNAHAKFTITEEVCS